MSRRSVIWKRKAKQAGGSIDKLIPYHATGTGTYQMHGPCVAKGWRKAGIVGDGHVCSKPMTSRVEQVVRRAIAPRR